MDLLTNRNQQIVCHESFQYIFDRLGADNIKKYYRCRRRDLNCKGRICITNGDIKVTGMHGGHDESPVEIEVSEIY